MYIVKYTGPFGFIKPWTAVRDNFTFSQQFLTPSIIEGIRQKLEVTKIIRHKLSYNAISRQQEQTQTKGWKWEKKIKSLSKTNSILTRGVMLDPKLYLAFDNQYDAEKAEKQHICLCRNEDVLLPEQMVEMSVDEFNSINGFELHFDKNEQSFIVGYNRFKNNEPMYGWIEITGNPTGNYI
ncbi:MAG: hypothetical protein ACOCWM_01700 [Cyclobacteriaceae bacterium]